MQERPALEVADILRAHGPAWREAERGHLSLAQLKVMSAITQCRTAALGGHVLRCECPFGMYSALNPKSDHVEGNTVVLYSSPS